MINIARLLIFIVSKDTQVSVIMARCGLISLVISLVNFQAIKITG